MKNETMVKKTLIRSPNIDKDTKIMITLIKSTKMENETTVMKILVKNTMMENETTIMKLSFPDSPNNLCILHVAKHTFTQPSPLQPTKNENMFQFFCDQRCVYSTKSYQTCMFLQSNTLLLNKVLWNLPRMRTLGFNSLWSKTCLINQILSNLHILLIANYPSTQPNQVTYW